MPDRLTVLVIALLCFFAALALNIWSSRRPVPTAAENTRQAVAVTATAVSAQATQAELDRYTIATTAAIQTETAEIAAKSVTGTVATPGRVMLTSPTTPDPGHTVLGRPATPGPGVILTLPGAPARREATPGP